MKITIDTKEDTHEDIQKVIKILSSLVGNQEVMSNQADLFGDDTETQKSEVGDSDTKSNVNDSSNASGGMFNMFNSSSEDKDSVEKTIIEAEEDKKDKKEDDLDIDFPDVEEYH